jgi:hypothetical protein
MDTTEQYLEELGLTNTVRNRLLEVVEFYRELLTEEISRVFLSETVGEDGQRLYESLWVITDHLVCEAHNALMEDNFDVASMASGFKHWFVKKTEYSPGVASTKSRLSVRFTMVNGVVGEMRASGANCDALFGLVREVILPNTATVGIPTDWPGGQEAPGE